MNDRFALAAVLMCCTFAAAAAEDEAPVDHAALSERVDELAQTVALQAAEIENLRALLKGTAAKPATADGQIVHQPIGRFPDDALVTVGEFDGAIRLPGSSASFKLGGYVQSDVVYDIDSLGFEDSLNLRTIPLDDSDRDETKNFRAHGRYSRLNLDIRDETDAGNFRLFLEMDFFGSGGEATNNYSPVLRHATAQLGDLYVGQWWSYFTDIQSSPESTTTTVGLPIVRNPGIRYAKTFAPGWRAGVGLENPSGDLSGPEPELASNTLPNVTGFIQYTADWGRIRLAGLLLELESQSDEVLTGGVNVSGRINVPALGPRDNVAFAFQAGEGFARYYATLANAGLDGATDADGNIDATGILGGYVAYQHWWTNTLRSTFQVGAFDFDSPANTEATAFDGGEGYMINLFWSPVANTTFGIEWIHARQNVVDDREGSGSRIGAIARFDF